VAGNQTTKWGFTVDVSIIEDHLLITNGLYRYLRHPSYTGLLITLLGAGLAMQNSWSLALLTIPFLIAITYRIKLEESLLLDEFGPAYEAYMKTTKRLIPLVFLAILMVEAHGIKTHCLTKKNTGMQQTASRIPNHYPPS
jgi:protein-S-isoprenylcysteine O-methyltransferase Ste14